MRLRATRLPTLRRFPKQAALELQSSSGNLGVGSARPRKTSTCVDVDAGINFQSQPAQARDRCAVEGSVASCQSISRGRVAGVDRRTPSWVECTFIQKRLHPNDTTNQKRFHPNDTFVQNGLTPMTLSSKDGHVENTAPEPVQPVRCSARRWDVAWMPHKARIPDCTRSLPHSSWRDSGCRCWCVTSGVCGLFVDGQGRHRAARTPTRTHTGVSSLQGEVG